MTSKSKSKGKSWERDVCVFLSKLYNDSFIRVPNSGAYTGGKNEFRKEYLTDEQIKLSRGDIIPPSSFCNFVVEAKNYAEFPFHQLVKKAKTYIQNGDIFQVVLSQRFERKINKKPIEIYNQLRKSNP